MLKVEDMSPAEMHALLQREGFGHLGCARDNRPTLCRCITPTMEKNFTSSPLKE